MRNSVSVCHAARLLAQRGRHSPLSLVVVSRDRLYPLAAARGAEVALAFTGFAAPTDHSTFRLAVAVVFHDHVRQDLERLEASDALRVEANRRQALEELGF